MGGSGVNGAGVAIDGGATNNLLNRSLLSTMSGVRRPGDRGTLR